MTDGRSRTGRGVRRREVLSATAAGAAAAAGVTVAGTTPAAAQSGTDLTDWLSNVENADGVVDKTGTSEVTVEVGVEANGGAFGFGPAVVRVDPGTTVVWEWTGEGGSHNVVATDGSFESKLTAEAGTTFERTFESAGVVRYACSPHEMVGMKGAVVVGDASVTVPGGGDGGSGGSDSSGSGGEATDAGEGAGAGAGAGGAGGGGGSGGGGLGDGALLIAGGVVGAFVSPILFGLLLLASDDRGTPAGTDRPATDTNRVETDDRPRRFDSANEAD
jgi:halocyanin-like protein